MQPDKKILLSFDVEEFDLPLEYNRAISTEEQLRIGYIGFVETLSLVDFLKVTTTLFTTGFFANAFPAEIRAAALNHEIASHGLFHSSFCLGDLKASRKTLQCITGQTVEGFRMPRMASVSIPALKEAGYLYDSSINPTWVPGRYNNLVLSRTTFTENGLWRLPVSVTPRLRFPLFWLSFKNLPYPLFLRLVRQTLNYDGYVNLYFHPWEFINLSGYDIPFYVKNGSNGRLLRKLGRLLQDLSNEGEFVKMGEFIQRKYDIHQRHIASKNL